MLNRIFQLPKFITTKLSRKILLPVLIVGLLILTGFFVFNYLTDSADNKARQEENSRLAEQFFNLKLHDLNDFALGLAVQSASNPEIQSAFAAQDRQKLMDLTLESYTTLKDQYDIAQYQFHLAPATSFLRLHSLEKYGDDLSSFRFTVLQVNETQKPVYGLEVGRGGAGIRGVSPVFYQGEHIGSVEFGLNFNETLLKNLKSDYGDDWRIILTREALSLATLDDLSTLKEGPTPNTLVLASTVDSIYPPSETYDKVINGERLITEVRTEQSKVYSITSLPLRDYSGKIIGITDIIIDNTALIQEQANRTLLLLIGLLGVLAIGSYTILTTINQSLKPLGILTSAANRIEKGDLSQKINLKSPDEIGQLGNAFNLMTVQLNELISSLEQRVADRTKAMATSTEVSRRLSTILDRKELVSEVVNQVKNAFGYYHTQIYLYDEPAENLIMAGGTGEAGERMLAQFHKVAKGRGLVGRAAENNAPFLVSDTSQNSEWLPNPLLPETKSEMAIPISIGEQVLGVLDVQHNIKDGLQQEDVNSLQSIANQVAIALQNIQSTEVVAKRAAELQTVARISTVAATIPDIQKMLESVVHQTQRGFGLYHAHIFLFNENLERLEIIACGYKEGDEHEGTHGTTTIPLMQEQSLVARAGRTRQAVIINDVRNEPGWLPNPLLPDTAAELAVPMIVGNQLLGVLDVQSDRLNAFTDEDANIQSTLASQVATAVQNARSILYSKRQAERETTVNLITQKIQSATTVESALQITARELGHALGMRQTQVTLNPEALADEQKGK